jgi:hypothetical protein
MRKTIIALAILPPVAAYAATKPAGCALLDKAACNAKRACAWSPPMVRGEKSPTTGKPYKITRRGYCHRRPLRLSEPLPQHSISLGKPASGISTTQEQH